jgi:hypothetical protein
MARENESAYFGATYQKIAQECDFKSPALARKFVTQTLGKVRREMIRRGIDDSQMPGTESLWQKIEDS